MPKPAKDTREILAAAGLNLGERTGPEGTPEFCISGDTHPYRRILRERGGRWDKLERAWVFRDSDPSAELTRAIEENPPVGLADSAAERPHYWGHRDRLRKRFLAGVGGFPDYELLELILFQCVPRIDVKPLAKDLLARFGSLGGVVAADTQRLAEFEPLNLAGIAHIKATRELARRLAREEVGRGPVLSSWDKLTRYLKTAMAHDGTEQFRVLFLNAKNELIADEVQHTGTVNHTPAYPREVIKRALELGATAVILVHNHPSGDPTPSRADIAMTREIAEAGDKLDIQLHDHVIVTKHGQSSFRDMGLI